MGIFDIFKSNSSNTANKEKITSPIQLFSIDLKTLPNESCKLVEKIQDEDRGTKTHYKSKLSPKELGLFDTLEIILHESGEKNYLFKSPLFRSVDQKKLSRLLISLYRIYGKDDSGAGLFDRNDELDIKDGFWTGRMWNSSKYKPHVMISGDNEDGLSMTIWMN